MCHTVTTVHRCQHRTYVYTRCQKAAFNPISRRWNMCDKRSTTVTDQQQSLCGKSNCELTKKGGVWICCRCRFGYKGSDRNRYLQCTSCGHNVCENCKEWNADNVAVMEAEDNEAGPASDDNNGSPIPDPHSERSDESHHNSSDDHDEDDSSDDHSEDDASDDHSDESD